MKLNGYRDELPFGDDALREIRGNVMKKIEDERPSPRWLGLFVRATLVAAVLLLLVVRPARVVPPANVPAANRSVKFTLHEQRHPDVAPIQPFLPLQTPLQTMHRPRRIKRIEPAPASAESNPAPIRIELQTSNPDIRILWITNPPGETR
jgi:hypothetical protein